MTDDFDNKPEKPKVTFEVYSMLREDFYQHKKFKKRKKKFKDQLKEDSKKGDKPGYSRDIERGFDPLTDEKQVIKQQKKRFKKSLVWGHIVTKVEALKRKLKHFLLAPASKISSHAKVIEDFMSVIQSIILEYTIMFNFEMREKGENLEEYMEDKRKTQEKHAEKKQARDEIEHKKNWRERIKEERERYKGRSR